MQTDHPKCNQGAFKVGESVNDVNCTKKRAISQKRAKSRCAPFQMAPGGFQGRGPFFQQNSKVQKRSILTPLGFPTIVPTLLSVRTGTPTEANLARREIAKNYDFSTNFAKNQQRFPLFRPGTICRDFSAGPTLNSVFQKNQKRKMLCANKRVGNFLLVKTKVKNSRPSYQHPPVSIKLKNNPLLPK